MKSLKYFPPNPSEIEKAYIAGFFDGDGCIHIGRYTQRDRKSIYHHLLVVVGNTNKPILDNICSIFHGNVNPTVRKENRRQFYNWKISSNQATEFLKIIYPYLRIKKEQAKIAIEFRDTFKYRRNQAISKQRFMEREKIRLELRRLKKSG